MSRSDSFVIPPLYAPRVTWTVWIGILLALATLEAGRTLALPVEQVPQRFTWEGSVITWAPRTPLTAVLPALYGALASLILLFFARRVQPDASGSIVPPTPLAGFSEHLSRAIAASMLQVGALHFAWIAFAMQWGLREVAASTLRAGATLPFNNMWVVAGFVPYLAYSAWLLLLFNRDAKRGQYGEVALRLNDPLVPPSVPHPPRAVPRPVAAPRQAPVRSNTVE